jgi:hypothetical protein
MVSSLHFETGCIAPQALLAMSAAMARAAAPAA